MMTSIQAEINHSIFDYPFVCFALSGILVVNVTWRGKTYVGTLMDATKHAWAPPR
jgi:hypothetical protein